jgi:hypothetical protein
MQTFGLKELLGRRQAPSDGTMTKCESAHAHVQSTRHNNSGGSQSVSGIVGESGINIHTGLLFRDSIKDSTWSIYIPRGVFLFHVEPDYAIAFGNYCTVRTEV